MRFPWFSGLTFCCTVVSLSAQPTRPSSRTIAQLASVSEINPSTAAASTPLTVSTTSREEVRQFYRSIYNSSENVPMGWTGSYATGSAGDTSAAYKEAIRLRINFFRALVGVPADVTLNSTFTAKSQLAAFMMSGNNTLQHNNIPTTWTYYSAGGADGAANSNLSLGSAGPDAITAYVGDSGSANTGVGHRRLLFYPQTQEMGTGDVPGTAGNNSLQAANASWVIDGNYNGPRPIPATQAVTYPPAGYVPYQLVWPRWSFAYPGADFSVATVTMTRGGQSVATKIEPYLANEGDSTLVWVYNGLDASTLASHVKPDSDTTYTVTVKNVIIGGVAKDFTPYNVTVFDPDVASADAATVVVTGPAAPLVGTATTYTVNKPAFASGFDWRTVTLSSYAKTYDAESGLDGIVATTSPSYAVVQSSTVDHGNATYRLAHAAFGTTELLVLPEAFSVNTGAAITFRSELGIATALETAHIQVSADDGLSWSDVYTQTGTSPTGTTQPSPTETSFTSRSISLSAYAGRTIRVRLSYVVAANGGSFFLPAPTNAVGWFIDDFAVTNVQTLTGSAITTVPSGSTFAFTPTAFGPVTLQARGLMFGAYPLEWGPTTTVSATVPPGTVINPARLINLSILTTLAPGESFSMGTVLGGSGTSEPKALVARAVGPSLAGFGISGFLPDPVMTLISGGVTVATNDNWGGDPALVSVFGQVGAFLFNAPDSKDAAVFRPTLPGGSYSVSVSDKTGSAGTVIAELYDATPSSAFTTATPRLINVSVLKNIGSGLTAGFVIGGSGSETVLIRAIGPSLASFGVGGLLADPKISVINSGTVLATNDNWAGDPALTAAFGQVGAFPLSDPNSKDAALLIKLNPGSYSVQVSGVNNTTGTALVEVYEVTAP